MKDLQTLKDFCVDQGELQYLCNEFSCDESSVVYTKEQADYLALQDSTFKNLKESMNQEEIELNA